MTVVTWSNTRHVATEAMTALADVSVELIDLRSLWPWDRDCVLTSAAKTGHLLVAHEAVRDGGFGAEVVATAVEEIPGLKVARLGAPRIPIPRAAARRYGARDHREYCRGRDAARRLTPLKETHDHE